jgi:hypothetical protein
VAVGLDHLLFDLGILDGVDLRRRTTRATYEDKEIDLRLRTCALRRKPHLWSDQELLDLGGNLNYDLAPDGKRFAGFLYQNTPAEEKGEVHITFLLNFFGELRLRAPVVGN